MRRRIKLTTRRELTAAISQRCRTADRKSKKLILDEFTKVTGYHRKHAIRILSAQPALSRERSAPCLYLDRISTEFRVLCVRDATLRDQSIKHTAGYTRWALQNHHVLA